MRQILRTTPFKIKARSSVPAYNPEANDTKTREWVNRLNALASSGPSKVYLGQLGALINYFNKHVEDNQKEIDWKGWKSRIITDGLVDQVKVNYQQQASQEYNLDQLFNEIFSKESKVLDEINNEMAFHTAIWLDCYSNYLKYLDDLSAISNLNDYSMIEQADMSPGIETRSEALLETHCYLPGSHDDVNLYGYLGSQFAWGKKVLTFYKHPADDFKAGKATKNSMGR